MVIFLSVLLGANCLLQTESSQRVRRFALMITANSIIPSVIYSSVKMLMCVFISHTSHLKPLLLIPSLKLSCISRGAVRGGKVRTILRPDDGRGPPREKVISTEGNARALHFSPAPTGLRSGQFSHHSSDAGRASGFSLCLYLDIHQLVMKKIAALVETT